MIKKPRSVPLYVKKLEALLRRLPLEHAIRLSITDNLAKRMAGYKGECEMDYSISYLQDHYHIFHDLRLYSETRHFQLDTLILSKYFILIIEVKNITGTLYFDTNFNQLIRKTEKKKEAFPDPILQINLQCENLKRWLHHHKYTTIPLESLIVISSPRSIIETSENNRSIYNKVIHNAKLPLHVRNFEKAYRKEVLTAKQIARLSTQLLQNHQPLETDILSTYGIPKSDVITGVQCDKCQSIPMNRVRGTWLCPTCGHTSKHAHLTALHDYALLFGPTITNRNMRKFLHIESKNVAKYLLGSMNLSHTGMKKQRVYQLPL
ncbi:nuclease-related domain-containing protein [Ectobacillus polymachus]|uniref:nuclease-related domain-containing protein n=1 Tax=Ectobacillus polymachus TaxID=1508806 RepID=UPI003A87D481